MKKVVIFGCLALAVLYIAGCGTSVVGTYKASNGSTLVISKNGFARVTFPRELTGDPKTTKSGYIPYEVKGDKLLFVTGYDSQGKIVEKGFNFKIQGNKLIQFDDKGQVITESVWTKQ